MIYLRFFCLMFDKEHRAIIEVAELDIRAIYDISGGRDAVLRP